MKTTQKIKMSLNNDKEWWIEFSNNVHSPWYLQKVQMTAYLELIRVGLAWSNSDYKAITAR